jgi:hypothetical protein
VRRRHIGDQRPKDRDVGRECRDRRYQGHQSKVLEQFGHRREMWVCGDAGRFAANGFAEPNCVALLAAEGLGEWDWDRRREQSSAGCHRQIERKSRKILTPCLNPV